MISLEAEETLLVHEGLMIGEEYRKKICPKCLGTKQQKERNCALFRGYSKLSCSHMGKSVDNKLKEKEKKLMQKIMGEVIELRVSQVSGIKPELLGVWQSLEDLYYQ